MGDHYQIVPVGTAQADSDAILATLKAVKDGQLMNDLRLLNYYQEIPVSYGATVDFLEGDMVDLGVHQHQAVVMKLLESADVLVQNFRPGVPKKYGFDYASLHKKFPRLIYLSISAYGQTGPYASKRGFGTLAEAMSGFTAMNAHPGGPPTNPPLALETCCGPSLPIPASCGCDSAVIAAPVSSCACGASAAKAPAPSCGD